MGATCCSALSVYQQHIILLRASAANREATRKAEALALNLSVETVIFVILVTFVNFVDTAPLLIFRHSHDASSSKGGTADHVEKQDSRIRSTPPPFRHSKRGHTLQDLPLKREFSP